MVIPGVFQVVQETLMRAQLRLRSERGMKRLVFLQKDLTPGEIFTDDHGVWAYHTVIAKAHPELVAHEANDESKEVAWVAFDQVENKNLTP